jgi:hypothetical protein
VSPTALATAAISSSLDCVVVIVSSLPGIIGVTVAERECADRPARMSLVR